MCVFFFNDPAPTDIYTLSLHDALPICPDPPAHLRAPRLARRRRTRDRGPARSALDRKSTRLNSSHLGISYAVFCLKKKKKKHEPATSAELNSGMMNRHTTKDER